MNELDKKARSMVGSLNKIHSTPADSREFVHFIIFSVIDPYTIGVVPALISSVRPILNSCKDVTNDLAMIVPENQFWRWKDMWSNSMRTAVFAAALIQYLEHRTLLSFTESAHILGSKYFFLSFSVQMTDRYLCFSQAGMER